MEEIIACMYTCMYYMCIYVSMRLDALVINTVEKLQVWIKCCKPEQCSSFSSTYTLQSIVHTHTCIYMYLCHAVYSGTWRGGFLNVE